MKTPLTPKTNIQVASQNSVHSFGIPCVIGPVIGCVIDCMIGPVIGPELRRQ